MQPSFVITTIQGQHHEWMAFACWYAIRRNMPDSKVAVVFPRSGRLHHFTWLYRCRVPYRAFGYDSNVQDAVRSLAAGDLVNSPVVTIRDTSLVVGPVTGVSADVAADALPGYRPAGHGEEAEIVDYRSCGLFDAADWVEAEQIPPFHVVDRLRRSTSTRNEDKVFGLWGRMADVFDLLNSA